MSSALYCKFDLAPNANISSPQDDEYYDTNWFESYSFTISTLIYALNGLSIVLALGVAIFIFATPRRDSYIFQTLGVLFFTTSIFQVSELLLANSTSTWGK